MKIRIGSNLVHPVHGPTVVVDTTTREWDGRTVEYAVLEHLDEDLVLHLPKDAIDEYDLRPAMGEDDAEVVLDLLSMPAEGMELTWRRFRKRNEMKMLSGTPTDVAEVVRDLHHKDVEKGLSPSERETYRRARARLVAELGLAVEQDADDLVDGALAA